MTVAAVLGNMGLLMTSELSRLEDLGIGKEKLAGYQVLCLPENIFAPGAAGGLLEPADAVEFAKLLKNAGVKCATAYDLALRASILDRRANDKWLGTVWIPSATAPAFVAETRRNSVSTSRAPSGNLSPCLVRGESNFPITRLDLSTFGRPKCKLLYVLSNRHAITVVRRSTLQQLHE